MDIGAPQTHVLVTKKMLIRKAKEICPNLRALTPAQLEDW